MKLKKAVSSMLVISLMAGGINVSAKANGTDEMQTKEYVVLSE